MKPIDPARWARIKLFAMDVDGVLTDGTVTVFSNGEEGKVFSILDGLGLRRLAEAGLEVAWISGRFSKATAVRASELKIPHLFQAAGEKRETLREIAEGMGIEADAVCYMGDDVVDLNAMEWAGLAVSVPDAVSEVLAKADWITGRAGGAGAVRDVCDILLRSRDS